MNGSQRRWAAAGIVLAALAGGSGRVTGAPQDAGRAAEQPPQPIFKTGISSVRVDVIVTDKKGEPVTDLQQSDFQITENGAAQAIEAFKLIRLDVASTTSDIPPRDIRSDSDEESEAARDDVRVFAFFLDDYHVRRGASFNVREPLARFIGEQLNPSDMLGVMYPLQAVSNVRFTRDHGNIVRSFGGFLGRKGDYTPQNAMEVQYADYPAEEVERIRNQVSLSALKALIMRLGGLKQGRKALILVSEGYANTLPPQVRDSIASLPGFDNPERDNPDAGRNDPNEDRRTFLGDSSLQLSLREVYDLANKNNVAIYPVDPRGLPAAEFDFGQATVGTQVDQRYLNASLDTLRTLAEETDGRAIVNRNDIAGGMRQIVRDTSAYYLIGYNSTLAPTDGKFHEIRVRVNRPGVQVRARKGYWAVTTEDVARVTAPRVEVPTGVETALATLSAATAVTRNVIRTWVGTSRGADGKTKVTLVWEPAPRGRAAATEAPARVMITAVGPDGAPYFRGRVSEPRHVRRRARQSADAPFGRSGRLAGARHRNARDLGSGSERAGRDPRHASNPARPDRARLSAAEE
jgi:VWFA-related protein